MTIGKRSQARREDGRLRRIPRRISAFRNDSLIIFCVCVATLVGPVGFEPTTSAESLVYGYLHALLNFLIPQFRSVCPVVMDSGARRHSFLGPRAFDGSG